MNNGKWKMNNQTFMCSVANNQVQAASLLHDDTEPRVVDALPWGETKAE